MNLITTNINRGYIFKYCTNLCIFSFSPFFITWLYATESVYQSVKLTNISDLTHIVSWLLSFWFNFTGTDELFVHSLTFWGTTVLTVFYLEIDEALMLLNWTNFKICATFCANNDFFPKLFSVSESLSQALCLGVCSRWMLSVYNNFAA